MNWQDCRGQKAVVIGAGPAGTCAAMYLARRGYQVDVYERRAPPEVDQACPGNICVLCIKPWLQPLHTMRTACSAMT